MPVHMVERRQHLDRAERMLSVELGRDPTLQEMADRAGLSLQQALAVEVAARASTSLDQPLVAEGDALFGDMIAGDGPLPEDRVDSTFRSEALCDALALLGEREHTVIALRFGLHGTEPKTLAEIGRRLGFSRERARQLERNALQQLAQLREMEPLAGDAQ
jgi:RNA polymerase sigma factor (sigma-70 family)